HALDRGAARDAVDERYAVEEEGRRERPGDEILERRLLALPPRAVDPGEAVERDRHALERHEHRDELEARDEAQHADHREQQQRVVLAALDAVRAQVARRQQHGDDRHGQDHRRDHRSEVERLVHRPASVPAAATGTAADAVTPTGAGRVRARTWRTSASADGSIRRVKTGLITPITSVSATSGSSTAASRGDRSGRPWFFGFVSSP